MYDEVVGFTFPRDRYPKNGDRVTVEAGVIRGNPVVISGELVEIGKFIKRGQENQCSCFDCLVKIKDGVLCDEDVCYVYFFRNPPRSSPYFDI